MISQEYIASIVIVVVSTLKAFGVELGNEVVTAVVTGAAALYVVFRKVQKGEITVLGQKVVSEE